jgi:cell division protein FtsN
MDNNGTVKSTQHQRLGTLVLNKTQAGLVLGFVVVGIIASFGVGFIVGMWYQANEHITPYEARPALATEEQAEGQGMTFYSTLTTRDAGMPALAVAAASATPPAAGAPDAASQLPTRPATPTLPVQAGERLPAPSAGPAPGTSAATSRLPVRTVAPAPSHTGARPPTLGSEAPPVAKAQTVAASSPSRSSGAGYSVQVGSFRTQEPAEQLRRRLTQKGYPARVQASVLSGKGVWYRVRVGHFTERLVADQMAQRLTTQERISTIVAAEEGQ